MSQHITVVDYNPLWPKKYEEEALLIKDILADNCVAIYHIGSTSVEGLAAKPIIDIMAAVQNLEKVDDAAEAFSKIGYEYLGEFGIAGRRYLRKGGDERTHQIHIFQTEDWNNIGRHLAFRDYMRLIKKNETNMQKSKKFLHRNSLMILMDIVTEKKNLCVKLRNSLSPNLMEHGIKCTLRHEMYRKKERFLRL